MSHPVETKRSCFEKVSCSGTVRARVFGVSEAAGKDAALKMTMPVDLTGCHALIEQLTCTIDELHREKQEIELAFAELLQRAFRNRSERYLNDPNQLRLDFKGTNDAADAAEGLAQAVEEAGLAVQAHVRRRHGRKPRSEALPEHLPRYEVEATVPEEQKHCPQHGARTLTRIIHTSVRYWS